MALLTRKAIRDDVVARLLAYPALAAVVATRVFPSRTTPVAEAQEPALCVYTSTENDTWAGPGVHNPVFWRTLEIVVVAKVSATTDALLEVQTDISDTIKRALIADANWIVQFHGGVTGSSVQIFPDAESDKRRCAVQVTFQVRYYADFLEV